MCRREARRRDPARAGSRPQFAGGPGSPKAAAPQAQTGPGTFPAGTRAALPARSRPLSRPLRPRPRPRAPYGAHGLPPPRTEQEPRRQPGAQQRQQGSPPSAAAPGSPRRADVRRAARCRRPGVPGEGAGGEAGKEGPAVADRAPPVAPRSGRSQRRVRATPALPRLSIAANLGGRSYCDTGKFNWCRFPPTNNSCFDKMTLQWFMSADHLTQGCGFGTTDAASKTCSQAEENSDSVLLARSHQEKDTKRTQEKWRLIIIKCTLTSNWERYT